MGTKTIADLETGEILVLALTEEEKAEVARRQTDAAKASLDEAKAAIRTRLASIDARSVRPLRAILEAQTAGLTPDPADVAALAELKVQADALRAGLAT